MKLAASQGKTTKRAGNDWRQSGRHGRDGASISPPAYGIDFVDRGTGAAAQRKENKTGLPDDLKAGIESSSGKSMDDVRVHYNSPKPKQFHAAAYTQGTDIYLGRGQQRHLDHEAWHVVQQKQGRVEPTLYVRGVAVNLSPRLEREADVMGKRARRGRYLPHRRKRTAAPPTTAAVQRKPLAGAAEPLQFRIERETYDVQLTALIAAGSQRAGEIQSEHDRNMSRYPDAAAPVQLRIQRGVFNAQIAALGAAGSRRAALFHPEHSQESVPDHYGQRLVDEAQQDEEALRAQGNIAAADRIRAAVRVTKQAFGLYR